MQFYIYLSFTSSKYSYPDRQGVPALFYSISGSFDLDSPKSPVYFNSICMKAKQAGQMGAWLTASIFYLILMSTIDAICSSG